MVADSEGCLAPRTLLPLRAVGYGSPVSPLGREETGRPGRPVSRSRLVRARRHEALVDVVLCRQMARQRPYRHLLLAHVAGMLS